MRRKLLIFALSSLPAIAVFLWLYPRILPPYQALVLSGANVGLGLFDPPMRVELTDDGGWKSFLANPDGSESFYWSRPGANLNVTYLSLALLPALLLATPVDWMRRLRMLGYAVVLLLLSHVLAAVGLVRVIYCLANTPGHGLCTWLRTIVNIYGQLMSFVLWGLLTWDVWLPRVGPDSAANPDPTARG